MSSKEDADRDGLRTLVDVDGDDGEDSAQASDLPPEEEADLEDKPTEVWATSADSLFTNPGEAVERDAPTDPAPSTEAAPEPDPNDFEAHLSSLAAPLPRMGDTLITPPAKEPEQGTPTPVKVGVTIEPEEHDTSLDLTLTDALSVQEEDPGEEDAPDTVEMTPDEAAAMIKAAQEAQAARDAAAEGGVHRLSETVEVSGEEGEAAARLAGESAADPGGTQVVSSRAPALTHQCRICGRRITAPRSVRFRGPADSERGLRCESCQNAICATHAVRVSGFWESLFKGGRFRCALCMPQGTTTKST